MSVNKGDLILKRGGTRILEIKAFVADMVQCSSVCGTDEFISPDLIASDYVVLNQGGSPEENQRIMRLAENG